MQGAQQGACSFPPAARPPRPVPWLFSPQESIGRNTHDSVISRRLSPIGRCLALAVWEGIPSSSWPRGWVGGWAPLFVIEGPRQPDPGVLCPLLGRSAHFVQRVGGLVEGGVQVLHIIDWSMEGLPECLGGWDPPSPWHPSGVDLVGTPQGVDGC